MLEIISNDCEAYADDTKILSVIKNFDSIIKLQRDIDKVCQWSNDWSTQLNVEKCKVVHIGNNNTEFDYTIHSRPLVKSNCERDLGIYIQNDLKWDTQVKNATSKANRILGCIRKSFKYPNNDVIKLLYSSLVRPHLEYAISSWCPFLKKDIKEIEKVQRRATKLAPELRNLDYQQRLLRLNLTNLETRRLRGDFIQMYKLINNVESINLKRGVNYNLNNKGEFRKYNLRSHNKCLTREQVKNCPSRYNFFTNRIVNHWNQLPQELIEAKNLNSFKAKLDEWLLEHVEATAIAQ